MRIQELWQKLRNANPRFRITRSRLLKALKLDPKIISKTPRAFALVDELSESTEDYCIRRMELTAIQISKFGRSVTRTRLMRSASLERYLSNPRFRKAFENAF